jgi:hypothetical protein
VLIGALLLAYGMIENKLLIIIGGLLFLPFLPVLLAIGFGAWTREWRLVRQGASALAVGIVLLFVGGALVALMAGPPFRFAEFNSPLISFLISLVVGVAAGLASTDDAGRREMIGLAATSQIAILPTWFGIGAVFGFTEMGGASPVQRAITLVINVRSISRA